MNVREYIKKRNGVAIGSSKSLRNNLYRSLGAKNFATFWTYWNPIFGYYLGLYIFKPLKHIVPPATALLCTFIFCGIIHDAVTTLLRGSISLFFTIWFIFMGVAVLLSKILDHDFSNKNWGIRVIINLSFVSICLVLTIFTSRLLH